MQRRPIDLEKDYNHLAAMQARSWEINFPGLRFDERVFRQELKAGVRYDDIFAYEENGELIGWLWLDWRMGARRAHIRHIQVAEEYWGQGYGKRILADAIAMARERGRTILSLNVTKSNKRAMRLYASMGFQVVYDQGNRQHMRLDLSAPSIEPLSGT